MTADLRCFEYPLEPLLQQRQWQLDAAMGELGLVVAELAALTEEKAALQHQLEAERVRSIQEPSTRLDLAARKRLLDWLQRVRDAVQVLDERAEALDEKRRQALAACIERHRDLEALELHREDQANEFLKTEQGRLAREADRDWLTRIAWTAETSARSTAEWRKEPSP